MVCLQRNGTVSFISPCRRNTTTSNSKCRELLALKALPISKCTTTSRSLILRGAEQMVPKKGADRTSRSDRKAHDDPSTANLETRSVGFQVSVTAAIISVALAAQAMIL